MFSSAFLLFAYDHGKSFTHKGVQLGNNFIPFLQFADDLVILCESANELQEQIDNLTKCCDANHLILDVKKTKTMIFHKGRLKTHQFNTNGQEIKIVTSFKYLGFTFSNQLSFSEHLHRLNLKARARIGVLYNRLPLKEVTLELALKVFDIYLLPIYRYGLLM